MTGEECLVNELKKYSCICYYPSSGTDLSNVDYLGSGKKPWEERLSESQPDSRFAAETGSFENYPDLFIHTDINFYQEFAAGLDLPADECGLHGSFEVLDFKELPSINEPNLICDNYEFSGKCFLYKLRVWNSPEIRTLIFCLCENEYFVSRILLANNINISIVWSRNWNGGQTYGTWLANILHKLHTAKVYTDWLCIPGKRGEPRNLHVLEKYPELMIPPQVKLVRNNDVHWIDEGAHGWVEEFNVCYSEKINGS